MCHSEGDIMSTTDKQKFYKGVCVIIDTREQENKHILQALEGSNISYEIRKLDIGDYSFTFGGRDFSLSCAAERKASVDELYGNFIHDRGRIEKEMYAASQILNEFTIFIENVGSLDELKQYKLSDRIMQAQHRQVADIGKAVYATLQSWKRRNRYNFDVEFCRNKSDTADKMLEAFYWHWRNYKELTVPRRK